METRHPSVFSIQVNAFVVQVVETGSPGVMNVLKSQIHILLTLLIRSTGQKQQ